MPKPKKKVVVRRVLKVKSSGAGKQKDGEKGEAGKKVQEVKSSGAPREGQQQEETNVENSTVAEVQVGEQEAKEEKTVVTPPITEEQKNVVPVAEVEKDDKEVDEESKVTPSVAEVQKDDQETKEEKTVKPPVAEVPKEELDVTPPVAEEKNDDQESKKQKASVKSSGAKKEERKTVINPPPVERHTTKENIKVFFDPVTYQNKNDTPEDTPSATVLDQTQDGASGEQLQETENTNKPDESGEDSKKEDGSTKESDGSGNGGTDQDSPEAETPLDPTSKDSSWWDWSDWSTWNSWSWDHQWWGWYDQHDQKTWSCQTTPESGTPSSQNLELSLGRLHTVDLESVAPPETSKKSEPETKQPEDKKISEEKEKQKKAAHARYMRYYRSVHFMKARSLFDAQKDSLAYSRLFITLVASRYNLGPDTPVEIKRIASKCSGRDLVPLR